MRDIVTRALRGRKVLLGRDFYQSRQVRRATVSLGNRFARWTFCPEGLNEDAVVYSFGVGEDISFDLQLMKRYHVQVFAFDPAPFSIKWVGRQQLPEGFHFHPYGLAAEDGSARFTEPSDPGARSLRSRGHEADSGEGSKTHTLPVLRLSSIMERLGHEKVDILKMDIEGAEYDVIGDILRFRLEVSQLLVEFHHRFEDVGIDRTRTAISLLNGAGYRIFHVSPSGEEFAFIQTLV